MCWSVLSLYLLSNYQTTQDKCSHLWTIMGNNTILTAATCILVLVPLQFAFHWLISRMPHNHVHIVDDMMMLSIGSISRVNGSLWGESTDHRLIPLSQASDAELWWFLWSAPEQKVWPWRPCNEDKIPETKLLTENFALKNIITLTNDAHMASKNNNELSYFCFNDISIALWN